MVEFHQSRTKMLIGIVSAVVIVVVTVLITGYSRVNLPRQASAEGIESPEAVQAYDRISRWPQFRFLRRMVVNELKKHHPQGVLADIGCGPGYLLAVMAKSLPQLHLIGVDISAEMMQSAVQNLSSLGLGERVSFRAGDVQKLPFEDNTMDFVVSTFSLHHWSKPKEALLEIYRALKPGGQFLIFDLRRDGRRLFYWLLRFAQTLVVPAAMRQVNEPTGSALSSYTPVEIEALLSETPFPQWKIEAGFGWMFIWGNKGQR